MADPSISLVSTVLNEAASLPLFLDALKQLERQPDEIIIVDAGSTDRTIEMLHEFSTGRPQVTILIEKGCSIARGRNIAIRHSHGSIIAVTDAGGRVAPNWLGCIVKPFETRDDCYIVGGWTEIDPMTRFEWWNALLQVPRDNIDQRTFLPSARSLAFRKESWEKVGGFPEQLTNWAEDTVFLQRLKAAGYKIDFAFDAVVYWRPRSTMWSFIRQYFNYGVGDGEARVNLWLNMKRLMLVLSSPALLLGLIVSLPLTILALLLLLVGFLRIVLPLHRPSTGLLRLIPLFGLVLVRESAQITGYVIGLLRRRRIQ